MFLLYQQSEEETFVVTYNQLRNKQQFDKKTDYNRFFSFFSTLKYFQSRLQNSPLAILNAK